MKLVCAFLIFSTLLISCVPIKKYEELQAKEQQCSDELAKYKNNALDYEASFKDVKTKYAKAEVELKELIEDTTVMHRDYKVLIAKYDKLAEINEVLENNFDKLRLSGARDVAALNADLEARRIELQKQEDALLKTRQDLQMKQQHIEEQQDELAQLNALIEQQEAATRLLKEKVARALKNFENQGLSVEERNGKIYVSLEAKLLFGSGSTTVENAGKSALIELAKVLEQEKELEIIVEGHTDTDKMAGSKHPKNNWELSVLRATSVIGIMTSNSEIGPQQLMAAGRSEFHPVDPSDKSKNRRIEIIISPNLDELFNLISE